MNYTALCIKTRETGKRKKIYVFRYSIFALLVNLNPEKFYIVLIVKNAPQVIVHIGAWDNVNITGLAGCSR